MGCVHVSTPTIKLQKNYLLISGVVCLICKERKIYANRFIMNVNYYKSGLEPEEIIRVVLVTGYLS